MSVLLRIQDLHKRFGSTVLFEGASVVLSRGDKVGLIGRNGSGKTTLCRLILGLDEPDVGDIARSPRLRLGYLEQQAPFRQEETALGFLSRATGREEWRCGKTAARFQIGSTVLSERVESLPGGYQTRLKLTAMLLREPNFLVLDEPTNYLDLKTLLLLERFLRDFQGGYLIVSHDREFLKRTAESTMEVGRGQVTTYPGGVEEYLAYKEEERRHEDRYNKNIEAKRRHIQRFIDRYRVRSATASRAQSKLKQLDKLQTIDIEHPIRTVRLKLPAVEARKGVALRADALSIGYPRKEVASDIRFEIERGAHVAVLGDNGAGKTTLLRTLAGQLRPLGGTVEWGHGLRAAYYAQHVYAALKPEDTLLEYLEREAARDVVRQDVLDMAGSFLFSGDVVHESVGVLSGGERARLCLAGVLLGRRPVLLLDEPTNHLDFETVEALGAALREYDGTIFFVSHDRTFVSLVATSVLEVGAGSVALYPSDYQTYVYMTEREIDDELGTPSRRGGDRIPRTSRQTRRQQRIATSDGSLKEVRARVQRLRAEISRLESRLSEANEERQALHRFYLENPTAYDPAKQGRIDELAATIAEGEARWLSLSEQLESFEGRE